MLLELIIVLMVQVKNMLVEADLEEYLQEQTVGLVVLVKVLLDVVE
jgi:hypothetical protein